MEQRAKFSVFPHRAGLRASTAAAIDRIPLKPLPLFGRPFEPALRAAMLRGSFSSSCTGYGVQLLEKHSRKNASVALRAQLKPDAEFSGSSGLARSPGDFL
ncbi:MAG TPA: hypothetical protein VFU55_00575 [Terracidiphilus sp.]|nr:hypothetical protein [Terracidiphilus sp.]